MEHTYYKILPKNYFGELLQIVTANILSSENVLVSSMNGCGSRTFVKSLITILDKDKNSKLEVVYKDLEVTNEDEILERIISDLKVCKTKLLYIIRHIHKATNPTDFLARLNAIKTPISEKLCFLITADHTGILDPNRYIAGSQLFFSHTYNLSPFTMDHTQTMIKTLTDFYGWNVQSKDTERIYKLSGGIPRIIKHICADMNERGSEIDNTDHFLSNPQISYQLNYLTDLVISYDDKSLAKLGIIDEENKIKSELLIKYIAEYKDDNIARLFPGLSELELKLVSYLYMNKDNPTPKEKLLDLMSYSYTNYSIWAVYKLVNRLKNKLSPFYDIVNIKSKGYILRSRSLNTGSNS